MIPNVFNLAVSWQDEDYAIFLVFFNKMEKFLKDEVSFAAAGFS